MEKKVVYQLCDSFKSCNVTVIQFLSSLSIYFSDHCEKCSLDSIIHMFIPMENAPLKTQLKVTKNKMN